MERMELARNEGNTMEWSPLKRNVTARELFDISWQDLLKSQPFFGAKMFQLEIIEKPGLETMATDGKQLLFDPEYVLQLKRGEITFVEFHEIVHVILKHPLIAASLKLELGDERYDHLLFNVAADHEANLFIKKLIDSGQFPMYQMPDDLFCDKKFDGVLVRDIYLALEAEQQRKRQEQQSQNGSGNKQQNGGQNGSPSSSDSQDNGSHGSDSNSDMGSTGNDQQQNVDSPVRNDPDSSANSGGMGSSLGGDKPVGNERIHGEVMIPKNDDGSDLTKEQIDELKHDADMADIAAAKYARKQGKGSMELILEVERRIKSQPMNWRDIFDQYFSEYNVVGQTYNRPDKRFYAHGIILPSKRKERVGKIAILGDESASVPHRLVALWFEKVNEIFSQFDSLEIVYIPFTSYAGEPRFYSEADLPIEFKRTMSGGTNFRPPFETLAECGFDPDVICVLTDMGSSSFPDDPGIDTFWCDASRYATSRKPPFGELIKITE